MFSNGKPAPRIRDFSDLALTAYFASYEKTTGGKNTKDKRPPMFIDIQCQTVPEPTRKAVVGCLAHYGISDLPGGDGVTFPIGTFGYEILLGTNPIAWMAQLLIHHKWKLSDAVIGAITVRDSENTQSKAAQEGDIGDKTPFFTLYVQRNSDLLNTARDKNSAFEAGRRRPFLPYPTHGPLSSKKGPFWPFPMRVFREGDRLDDKPEQKEVPQVPGF